MITVFEFDEIRILGRVICSLHGSMFAQIPSDADCPIVQR